MGIGHPQTFQIFVIILYECLIMHGVMEWDGCRYNYCICMYGSTFSSRVISLSFSRFGINRLKVESKSESHYDLRSVGQSVLVSSPVWGPRPDFVAVRHKRFCRCVTPSVTRGRVCNLSRSQSAVHDIYIYRYTCRHSA
jgi:hypothetical protein